MNIDLERHNLDFSVAKSVRYHAYCRSFWENIDRWTKILTVFSGTAVLVSLLNNSPAWVTKVLAFTVALLCICDVVLGFGANAKRHDELYRRFCRLGMEIGTTESVTETDIRHWRGQRLDIEMEEPGTKDWLERRCAAEEAKSRGLTVRDDWKISAFKWKLAPFILWPNW